MGLIMWINFSWINAMYIYWPAVLIGVTVIIVFLPARVLYHQSRKWWAFSNVSDLSCVDSVAQILIARSGAFFSQEFTPLNSVTFSWETCTALRPMPWG